MFVLQLFVCVISVMCVCKLISLVSVLLLLFTSKVNGLLATVQLTQLTLSSLFFDVEALKIYHSLYCELSSQLSELRGLLGRDRAINKPGTKRPVKAAETTPALDTCLPSKAADRRLLTKVTCFYFIAVLNVVNEKYLNTTIKTLSRSPHSCPLEINF